MKVLALLPLLYLAAVYRVEQEDHLYRPLFEVIDPVQARHLKIVDADRIDHLYHDFDCTCFQIGKEYLYGLFRVILKWLENVITDIMKMNFMSMLNASMIVYDRDFGNHEMFVSLCNHKMVDEDDKVMELLHHLEGAALSCVDIILKFIFNIQK